MTPPSIFPGSAVPFPTGQLPNGGPGSSATASNSTQAQSFAVVRPKAGEPAEEEVGNVSVAFSFFLPVVLVSMLAIWVLYAYRNPHTKSGQLLIQVSRWFDRRRRIPVNRLIIVKLIVIAASWDGAR